MLSNTSRRVLGTSSMAPISQAAQRVRFFSRSTAKQNKVCVIGAAGGIGQPLSLLLGNNDMVKELRLYDVAPITPGVAADLSHINTPAQVTGYCGPDELAAALKDADIVVCPAGVPRKPGMTRDDLFNINAGIVAGTAKAVAENCPNALFLIISNPVNSTVPIAAETLKKAGVHDPRKVFGVTTLDITRANTFIAENQGFNVHDMNVPVIGGHAGTTILPLLSQVKGANFTQEDKEKLTHRIMFGGDEVVQAKAGGGSATLSMAYAGAEFAFQCMRARAGADETACTFVECDVASTQFFSTQVKLGPEGVKEVLSYGELDAFEQEKYDEMIPVLQEQIQKGIDYVNKN